MIIGLKIRVRRMRATARARAMKMKMGKVRAMMMDGIEDVEAAITFA